MSANWMASLAATARSRLTVRRKQLRFVVAGALNTVFGFAIFPILLWSFSTLHRHYMLGLIIAQALSLCFAFMTYKLTVFRTRSDVAGEFSRFLPFYLANYAVNWFALPVLVKGASLDPIVAQILFSAILMVGSYFWHSRITFRTKGQNE
jgi:putative flippase GtrA